MELIKLQFQVINKTDLAPAVGADLAVMERDALRMRDGGPFFFAQVCVAHCYLDLIAVLNVRTTHSLPVVYFQVSLPPLNFFKCLRPHAVLKTLRG